MTAVVEVGDWGRIKGQHGKVSHLWLYPARVNPYFIAACGIEHPTDELMPERPGESRCAACREDNAPDAAYERLALRSSDEDLVQLLAGHRAACDRAQAQMGMHAAICIAIRAEQERRRQPVILTGCDCDAYDGDHAASCTIYVQPAPRRR